MKLVAIAIALHSSFVLSVETTIDQHLCTEALPHLLPSRESKDLSDSQVNSIVSALVQVDLTMGITPCQYRRLKGLPVHPDQGGVFIPPGGLGPPDIFGSPGAAAGAASNSAAQAAIREMAGATAEDSFSSNEKTSTAFREGMRAAAGLKMAAGGLKTGAEFGWDLTKQAFDGTFKVANAITNFIFPGYELDFKGRWVNEAGEAVGDVVLESFKGTTQFFSGVVTEIFPSVTGRRRVVYDKDCDMVEHEIDSIEPYCSNYRYERLQHMYPVIKVLGEADTGLITNRTRLNTTVAGDPISFTPGMREVFMDQRNALYGINGTCTKPTRGSISLVGQQLQELLFEINEATESTFDTHWTNLKTINDGMKNITQELTQVFVDGVSQTFNVSLTGQAMIARNQRNNLQGMLDDADDQLASVTASFGNRQSGIQEKFGQAVTNAEKQVERSGKTFTILERKLDQLTDLLDVSPEGLGKFTETLIAGVEDVLRNVNESTQASTRDVFLNSLTPNAKKLVDQFGSHSDSSLVNTRKDWEGRVKTFAFEYVNSFRNRENEIRGANANVTQSFDSADVELGIQLADLLSNQTGKSGNAQATAQDTARTSQSVQARQRALAAGIKTLFQALKTGNENTISDARTKISQILSLVSAAAGDKLTAASVQINNAGESIVERQRELDVKLSDLAYRLYELIAQQTQNNLEASKAKQDALHAASELAYVEAKAVADSAEMTAKTAGGGWQRLGGDTVLELEKSSSEAENERRKTQRHTELAAGAIESIGSEGAFETGLIATGSANEARRNLVSSGQSLNGLSQSAGSELRAQKAEISATDNALKNVLDSQRGASSQTEMQSSSLFESLGQMDSETASDFASSARALGSQAGGLIDKSLAKIEGDENAVVVDLANHLSKTRTGTSSSGIKKIEWAQQSLSGTMSGLADIEDELSSLPATTDDRQTSVSGEAKQDLESAVLKSSNAAQSIGSELGMEVNQLVGDIRESAAKAVDENAAEVESKLSSIGNEIEGSKKTQNEALRVSIEDRTISDQAILAFANSIVAIANILKDVNEKSAGDDANIVREIQDLKSMILKSNSTVLEKVMNISSEFLGFNSSFSDKISQAIQQYLDTLQADGLKLMDVVAAEARKDTAAVLDSDFSSAASEDLLDEAGKLSESFTKNAAKNREDFDRNFAKNYEVFSGIKSEISDAKKFLKDSRDQALTYSDYVESTARKAAGETSSIADSLATAVESANSSLGLLSGKTETDSSFAANMNRAHTGSMLNMGNAAVNRSQELTKEADIVVDETVTESHNGILTIESSMRAKAQEIQEKVQKTLNAVNNSQEELLANISSDKTQTAMQLMMAQRAVKTLIDSWNRYAKFETEKFQKLNESDHEYIVMVGNRIVGTNDSSGSALRTSQTNMNMLNEQVLQAVLDYLGFRSAVAGGLDGYRQGLQVMNQSADAGIAQLKEMIYNLNANDEFMDSERKEEMRDAVEKFNAELDRRAKEATTSLMG